MGIFSRIAVDPSALRESRDFRLLTAGTIITWIGALTTGWPEHGRWLGRIVIGAVAVWGPAIAAAGFISRIYPA